MLESHHYRTTLVRAGRESDTVDSQFWLSMGLAFIEASELVLATAKRRLRAVPTVAPRATRPAHLIGSHRRANHEVSVRRPELVRQQVEASRESVEYEGEW
jgi:hypothetical protein